MFQYSKDTKKVRDKSVQHCTDSAAILVIATIAKATCNEAKKT